MARWRRWAGPRGSIEHPESALNLRLMFALFGLVNCGGGAILAAVLGWRTLAVVLGLLALAALVDIVIIQRRRKARHGRYSLFE